jgi:MFS family permease
MPTAVSPPRANTAPRPPIRTPFFYGWVVLGIAFLTILTGVGVRSSPSVLINPFEAEFGWSRASISLVLSVNLLLFGIASPVSGWLIDRYGPRRVMLGSLVAVAAGVAGTMAMSRYYQFFLVWGIGVGVGAGGVGTVLTAAVANRWFVERRGLALGVLGSASSTGQLIFIPLFMAVIASAGWRTASLVQVVLTASLVPIVLLWMRDDPADVGLAPFGMRPAPQAAGGAAPRSDLHLPLATRDMFATSTFWLLATSFFVCGGTSAGLIGTHMIPHELDHGISQVAAASVMGVMGGLNFVGTIFSGWMTDRVSPRKWLALMYVLRGVSLLLLPFAHDLTGLLVFAVVYGLDWFATVPTTMAIAADTFGRRDIGRVYGWIFLAHQIGAALMASAAGVARTYMGDYSIAFVSGGVVAIAAAGLAWQARPVAVRRRSAPAQVEAAEA